MQRVEARQPHYSQEVWDEERRINLSYLQRISRYPEGYQHVLEKEGVPPPVKGPLKIRFNRSEQLRKTTIENLLHKKNVDDLGNPRRGRPRTQGHHKNNDEEPKEIYITKSEKLRREYIKILSQSGGQRHWNAIHAAFRRDPLDVSRSASSSPEHGQRRKSRSASPQRIEVRMNRAQKLRLEEKKAKKLQAEQVWKPTNLDKIEARIDFGKDGWNETMAAERDRETQINTVNVDESEYEFEMQVQPSEIINASMSAVLQGLALRKGFSIPDLASNMVRICWSSNFEDCELERMEIYTNIVPKIREMMQTTTMEFFIKDLKWGVPRPLIDSHKTFKINIEQLEHCAKVWLTLEDSKN